MLKILLAKLKESFASVLPITLIVLIVSFTPLVSLSFKEMVVFAVCAVFLVVGIGLFNLGADLAMTPMGEHMGSGLAKSRRVLLLASVCFVMGVLITIAEPDLSVLAEQVKNAVNPTMLIATVGIGVGLFLLISIFKIVFKKDLSAIIIFFYMVLFMLGMLMVSLGKEVFVPLAFDSGGVTTGPITVPFIMALGVGVAGAIGGKHASENSFGLIALCSVGPMLALMGLVLFAQGDLTYTLSEEAYSIDASLGANFLPAVAGVAKEVLVALGLIVAFFVTLQLTVLKLSRAKLAQIGFGIVYTFVGLVIFLTAVAVGFMPIGFELGQQLAQLPRALVISGFVIGMVVVLAEPAVHVLNKQVEEITGGLVTKRSMLIALSVGVGISIGLSMIRLIYGFPVIYYLIPGYFLSLGLSFFVPKLYTAIAFDSGGVASGPLTSSFILPLAIGACSAIHGEGGILSYAFGVVAMVAMTPLITIQILGFKAVASRFVRNRMMMRRIQDADDEQIIDFM
ncbi:Protein of unknown function [Fibrobacter sp. UWH9]|uniref:DUF1538 domain-containing protein n=1 Tax=unclassified Fibrobacter TaxID=2634177 RepID=UPI00091E11F4|nr:MULTISPECIES: DUF1538 domain-containing protein [Fibrobacter]MCQ2099799.1 DUF1538 domain-containing protein [Fibrobacter sp.]MCL4101988.1 hypothetical protein [Fibrobacter succinogenes]MDO4946499.1 DUF1538 domain-containing protein [Fibrobacter sp.]OWV05578.1 hypothetical protein B7993_08240 [Fibrobacter sp. UWH3]OWV16539.1 hypothetical protein B7992_02145 [Fibrobacter sp. UWH1]